MIDTDTNFDWFWQPPINGQPGLIMIVDQHPGPEYPEAKFVFEVLDRVLLLVESQIDKALTLNQFSIFIKDHARAWHEVEFPYANARRFRVTKLTVPPAHLSELWDQRNRHETPRRLN